MPTKTSNPGPTDLDYDTASLTELLSDDALDVLDTVYDAQCNVDEFVALLALAKRRIEQYADPFEVREQVATDLLDLAAIFTAKAKAMAGIYATETN